VPNLEQASNKELADLKRYSEHELPQADESDDDDDDDCWA
jgi:hypothetical protein